MISLRGQQAMLVDDADTVEPMTELQRTGAPSGR